ncbi:MAG: hypothetical protein PHU14_09055 [Methylovulum sp.]|nr:hypothetical protein [Methylovulum sp.]
MRRSEIKKSTPIDKSNVVLNMIKPICPDCGGSNVEPNRIGWSCIDCGKNYWWVDKRSDWDSRKYIKSATDLICEMSKITTYVEMIKWRCDNDEIIKAIMCSNKNAREISSD